MMKCSVFTKRNIKELLRSPVSWGFGVAMPIAILIIMQVIMKSIGEEAIKTVPMFGLERFSGGVLVFGFSFLTMFCTILISNDRATSFLQRLYSSPMKASGYIWGYAFSVLPLAGIQILLTYGTAICFGMTPSWNILIAILTAIPTAIMYIGLGILMGSFLNTKSGPPLSSVVVQLSALLSGMWFDLESIGGGFKVFCKILPFANAYDVAYSAIKGDFSDIVVPLIIVVAYAVVIFIAAVFAFKWKMKRV